MAGLGNIPEKGVSTYKSDPYQELGRIDRRWLVGLLKDGKMSGGVEEAPLDGQSYVRSMGEWSALVIDDNGGVSDITTATLPLDAPTVRSVKALEPPAGLTYQKDLNIWFGDLIGNNSTAIVNNTQLISDLSAVVDGKADASAIPSLDGYATEQWVLNKSYITAEDLPAVQDLSAYATTEWVKGQGYATTTYVNQQVANLQGALSTRIDTNEQAIGTANGNIAANAEQIKLNKKAAEDNAAAIAAIDTSGDGPDLSAYALKTDIPTDNASLANGAGYHPR